MVFAPAGRAAAMSARCSAVKAAFPAISRSAPNNGRACAAKARSTLPRNDPTPTRAATPIAMHATNSANRAGCPRAIHHASRAVVTGGMLPPDRAFGAPPQAADNAEYPPSP